MEKTNLLPFNWLKLSIIEKTTRARNTKVSTLLSQLIKNKEKNRLKSGVDNYAFLKDYSNLSGVSSACL